MNDANYDINMISMICSSNFLTIITEVFKIFGSMIGLGLINWKLAAFVLIFIPVKILIMIITNKIRTIRYEEILQNSKDINRWQNDNYEGVTEIKLWNLYKVKENEYDSLLLNNTKIMKKLYRLDALDVLLQGFVESGMINILYLLSGMLIWGNELTIGHMFSFLTYSNSLLQTITIFSSIKMQISQVSPSIKSYEEFLDYEEEKSKKEVVLKKIQTIEFQDVCYAIDDKVILDHISFRIEAGDRIGIYGENGSGKSTITKMILRFIEPDSGVIKINDLDIASYSLPAYRERFSVMSQEVFLFNTSISENILMYQNLEYDKKSKLYQKLLSFTKKFPQKENTIVGTDGNFLSGGEKQRIALLRAISRRTNVLIFDEATSNCDTETESYIKSYLLKPDFNITIVITHDFEQLKNFNKIILLNKGQIERKGEFSEIKEAIP